MAWKFHIDRTLNVWGSNGSLRSTYGGNSPVWGSDRSYMHGVGKRAFTGSLTKYVNFDHIVVARKQSGSADLLQRDDVLYPRIHVIAGSELHWQIRSSVG